MIIKQTLLSTLLLLKYSDIELWFHLTQSLDLRSESDPHSGAACSGTSGSYRRKLVTIVNGAITVYELSVMRLRFTDTDGKKSTHAILLDIMKAHSSFSLRFVLMILYYALYTSCTQQDICDRWNISQATLRRWKELYHLQSDKWMSVLKRANRLCDDIASSELAVPAGHGLFCPIQLLRLAGLCFLQGTWNVRRAFPSPVPLSFCKSAIKRADTAPFHGGILFP